MDLNGVPREIITIMQGTLILSIVVAYQLVKIVNKKQEQKFVGKATLPESNLVKTEGVVSK